MRALLRIAATLLTFVSAPALSPLQAQSVAITHVTVLDPASGTAQADVTVVISGDRIADVGRAGSVEIPSGARVIDGRGQYLIPGLWDMHVHLSHARAGSLPLFVANGVLGVRDMGGEVEQVLAWRDAVAAGRLLGPRILAPGPVVETPEWLAMLAERGGDLPSARALLRQRVGVGTVEEARQAVDSMAALGADFVKLRNSGSREAYLALLREARRQNLSVVGHAPRPVGPGEASDSGHASFEHAFVPALDGMTPADRAALFRRFRANGTAVTPTLLAGRNHRLLPDSSVLAALMDTLGTRDPRRRYVSPGLVEKWREEWELTKRDRPRDWAALHRSHLRDVGEMQREGVRILAGTDVGVQLVYPGWSLHEELEMLVVDAGLSPQDALRSATVSPAEFLGLQHRFGSVAVGKTADLVLLDADPLEDIRNTRRIRAVVHNGQILERAALDALLEEAKVAARR